MQPLHRQCLAYTSSTTASYIELSAMVVTTSLDMIGTDPLKQPLP